MKKNYDKSLTEVWEWKENIYQDVKNLSAEKYIEKIKSNAESMLTERRIQLTTVSTKKERQKVA